MIPKFRCFDKNTKTMHEVVAVDFKDLRVYYEAYGLRSYWSENTVLMQSTGLFDIHGVEIFEGSIVKYSDGEYSYIGYVDRDCYVFWIIGIDPDDNFNFEDVSDTNTCIAQLEVIGDIYSNPELLEVNNDR